ncbi:MAG: leucyl aminopeptidase [Actinomycetota bacterium]|nr:leucyl aminopeptidase [Actinomycetota bacterium]
MPTFQFRTTSPAEADADVLVLPIFQGPEAGPGVREVGAALDADLAALCRDNGVRGRLGEALTVPTLGKLPAKTVLLVGLGPKAEATTDTLRRAMGRVARRVVRFATAATTFPQAAGRSATDSVQATVEGLLLGSYRFTRYKTREDEESGEPSALATVTVLGPARWDAKEVKEGFRRGEIVSESVAWARDMVNAPAIDATPDHLAQEAEQMAAEVGLQFKVWTEQDLADGGFGGVIGVGQGSVNPPRFVELTYKAGSGPPIALTGKGITFDSGGLSIKDAKQMEWMKSDMGGAAAMLAVMRSIALLKPRVGVIAAIPFSENLPGGASIRPGDVLKHRGGKTSEVLNTDAEGRLVLADALAFLSEQKPRVLIDAATLTGACMIALGDEIWGVMGNDRTLIRDLISAGEAVGEPGWELPLWKRYREKIRSPIADVKNIGDRWGGAITAALFLAEFVGDTPWCHMDVAGTAFHEKAGDYWPRGATGSPARTVIRYILDQAARDGKARSASRARARAGR